MKKEFLVATPKDKKGEAEETRVTENEYFNPFRKWREKKAVPQPAASDVPEGKFEEYATVFLVRKAPEPRKQTYISNEIYTRLSCVLPLLSDGMTIPTFLDNVLTNHLETHAEELRELLKCKVKDFEPKKEQVITPTLRNKTGEYVGTFLTRKESVHRRQTYINHETYAKLACVLPLFCDGMTVPVFLDNVLLHHLDTYGQELGGLIDHNMKNIRF